MDHGQLWKWKERRYRRQYLSPSPKTGDSPPFQTQLALPTGSRWPGQCIRTAREDNDSPSTVKQPGSASANKHKIQLWPTTRNSLSHLLQHPGRTTRQATTPEATATPLPATATTDSIPAAITATLRLAAKTARWRARMPADSTIGGAARPFRAQAYRKNSGARAQRILRGFLILTAPWATDCFLILRLPVSSGRGTRGHLRQPV